MLEAPKINAYKTHFIDCFLGEFS